MLLAAVVMLAGWMIALCETHEEGCHAHCTCALPCCQVAVLSDDEIIATCLDVTGVMQVGNQTALSITIAPILRPPKV